MRKLWIMLGCAGGIYLGQYAAFEFDPKREETWEKLADPRYSEELSERDVKILKQKLAAERIRIEQETKRLSEYSGVPEETLELEKARIALERVERNLKGKSAFSQEGQEEYDYRDAQKMLLANLNLLRIIFGKSTLIGDLQRIIEDQLKDHPNETQIVQAKNKFLEMLPRLIEEFCHRENSATEWIEGLNKIDKVLIDMKALFNRLDRDLGPMQLPREICDCIETDIEKIEQKILDEYTYKIDAQGTLLQNFFKAVDSLKKYYSPDNNYQQFRASLQQRAVDTLLAQHEGSDALAVASKQPYVDFLQRLKLLQQLYDLFDRTGQQMMQKKVREFELEKYAAFDEKLAENSKRDDLAWLSAVSYMYESLGYSFLSKEEVVALRKKYNGVLQKSTERILQNLVQRISLLNEREVATSFDDMSTFGDDIRSLSQVLPKYTKGSLKALGQQVQEKINGLVAIGWRKISPFMDYAQYQIRATKSINPHGYKIMAVFYDLHSGTNDGAMRQKIAAQAKTFYTSYMQEKVKDISQRKRPEGLTDEYIYLANVVLPNLDIKKAPHIEIKEQG